MTHSRGFPRVETRKPCPVCGHTRYYVHSGACLGCTAKRRAESIKASAKERGFIVAEKSLDIEAIQKREQRAMHGVDYG